MNDTQPTYGAPDPAPAHRVEIDGLNPGSGTDAARAAAAADAEKAQARLDAQAPAAESQTPFSSPAPETSLRDAVVAQNEVVTQNMEAAVIAPGQLGTMPPPMTPLPSPAIEEFPTPTESSLPSPTVLGPSDTLTPSTPTGPPTRPYDKPAPEPGQYDTPLVQPYEQPLPESEPATELSRAEVAEQVLSLEEKRDDLKAKMDELDRTRQRILADFRANKRNPAA